MHLSRQPRTHMPEGPAGFTLVELLVVIAIIGTLIGLRARLAAFGGALISLSLWLTVSWQTSPGASGRRGASGGSGSRRDSAVGSPSPFTAPRLPNGCLAHPVPEYLERHALESGHDPASRSRGDVDDVRYRHDERAARLAGLHAGR